MKRTLAIAAVALAAACLSYFFLVARRLPKVEAAACSDATVSGAYGGMGWGFNYGNDSDLNSVNLWTFNGSGSVSEQSFAMSAGRISQSTPSGTYSVGSNCIGGISLNDGETYTFTVVSGGSEVQMLDTSTGLNFVEDLKKQ